VLDDAGAERAIYWGYSWGCMLGFGMALTAPQRFDAWVLGGMHPYGDPSGRPNARVAPLRQGMEAYLAWIESTGQAAMSAERRTRMLASDATAFADAAEGTEGFRSQPEALPKLTAPSLFYAGTADKLFEGSQRAAGEVPGARFVALPGLNHGQASGRSDLILPHVLPFLAAVTPQTIKA
jgi:pimeloyl-ACP methyl ester carboxylesterase